MVARFHHLMVTSLSGLFPQWFPEGSLSSSLGGLDFILQTSTQWAESSSSLAAAMHFSKLTLGYCSKLILHTCHLLAC